MLGLRSFFSVRDFIEGAGARYSTAIEYLHAGIQRATLVGRLSQVLEHIEERELPYKDVAVMGYSFGTLVALDALFLHGRPPDLRFERVETLVTIGCPFDLTRAFWPAYASQPQAGEVAPRRWINVYSPLDVLGSNFRDEDTVGDSEWSVARRPGAGVGVGADIKPTNRLPRRTGGGTDPGPGRCCHLPRYPISQELLERHRRGRVHLSARRRVRLKDVPLPSTRLRR